MTRRQLNAIKQISKEIIKKWDGPDYPILIEIKQTEENYSLVYEACLEVENCLDLELDCVAPTFNWSRGYLIWFNYIKKEI